MAQLKPLRTTPPYDEPWKVATWINKLLFGKLNSWGLATLANGAASTVISDNNYKVGSIVILQALTAHGAAALVGAYVPQSSTAGQFTINHTAVAQADNNIAYLILS